MLARARVRKQNCQPEIKAVSKIMEIWTFMGSASLRWLESISSTVPKMSVYMFMSSSAVEESN